MDATTQAPPKTAVDSAIGLMTRDDQESLSAAEEAFLGGAIGMCCLQEPMRAAVDIAMRGSFRAGFFAAVELQRIKTAALR
jgi:hypothetical protein